MCLRGGICSSAERDSVGVDSPSSRQDVPDMLQPVGDRIHIQNTEGRIGKRGIYLSVHTLENMY